MTWQIARQRYDNSGIGMPEWKEFIKVRTLDLRFTIYDFTVCKGLAGRDTSECINLHVRDHS